MTRHSQRWLAIRFYCRFRAKWPAAVTDGSWPKAPVDLAGQTGAFDPNLTVKLRRTGH